MPDTIAQPLRFPLAESLSRAFGSLVTSLSNPLFFEQVAALLFCLAMGLALGGGFTRLALRRHQRSAVKTYAAVFVWAIGLVAPLTLICLIWLAGHFFLHAGHEAWLVTKGMRLAETWLTVRVLAGLLPGKFWGNVASVGIWVIAGLEILGILPLIIDRLDSIGFDIQKGRLSLWALTKTFILILLMLPVVGRLTGLVDRGLSEVDHLSASNKVLIVKLTRVGLFALAVLLAMDTVGLDFDMLTLFGGAVGLGVGFGLQKVVSNLVSGLVILMDNSVRPGDVIELGSVYGWIESLNARYVSVMTRDGTSHLLPNDEMIASRLVNWTHTGPGVRLKITLGISYKDNPREALELMAKACREHPRVLASPEPVGRLQAFGESSIDLLVKFWIADPKNGLSNVKSDIQLAIYDSFRQAGISFPYPHRELTFQEGEKLAVRLDAQTKPSEMPDEDGG